MNAVDMVRRCGERQAKTAPHYESYSSATRHDPDPVNTQTLHHLDDYGLEGVDRLRTRGEDDSRVPTGDWA